MSSSGMIMYEKFSINLLSVLANSLVILLSFRSSKIPRNHFRYFIANTAFRGIICTINGLIEGLILSLVNVFDFQLNIFTCNIPFAVNYWTSGALWWSYAMTVVCRYREIVLSRSCSRLQVTSQLLLPYIMCSFDIVTYICFSDYTELRINGRKCLIYWYTNIPILFQAVLFLLPGLAFCILFTLSYRLYKYLRGHFKNATANLLTCSQNDRVEEEKSILRAILIQGISPIVLVLPELCVTVYAIIFGWNQMHGFLGLNAYDVAREIARMNPLVDAISVLYVVLSYKRARQKFAADLWSKLSCKTV